MIEEIRQIFNRDTLYPRFWYTIPFRWIGALIILMGYLVVLAPPNSSTWYSKIVDLTGLSFWLAGGLLFIASLVAPFAVYHERQKLKGTDGWYPSRWYYLMLFPTGLIGFILTIVYTRRRLRHYGYESVSFDQNNKDEEILDISQGDLAEKIKNAPSGHVITKQEFKKLSSAEDSEGWWENTAKPTLAKSDSIKKAGESGYRWKVE